MEEFEAGMTVKSTAETEAVYGHVSSTVTVSKETSDIEHHETKRIRLDRPCCDDLEGYKIQIKLTLT